MWVYLHGLRVQAPQLNFWQSLFVIQYEHEWEDDLLMT